MKEQKSSNPMRILFVDDELNILSALKRLFMDERFEVITANSGKEAVQLLHRDKSVAVIVSDQRMPEMTGAEFLEKAGTLAPDAVKIILTGYADIQAAMDAINKGGAYRYISKPWNDEELISTIREAASRYALLQENRRLTEIVHRQNAELKQWSSQLEYDVQRQTIEIQKKNDELRKVNDRLQKTFRDSISAFAGLIELRDRTTLSHSRNVADLAAQAARDMALPGEEIETITVAALLHDIGKIGIPDVVLLKNFDALNPEEQQEYLLHSVRGQAAIDGIEDLRPAGSLIRHHHEAYNGNGFPDRLKGDSIPLGARIIAIADFFDRALPRYQGTGAVDLAWHSVKQEEGKKFDPAICRAMETCIRSFYAGIVPKIDMIEFELSFSALTEGIVLSRDVRSGTGLLLLSKGTALDAKNIQALKRYHQLDPSKNGVYVWKKR